ncbi:hypothetical protein [Bradyrhizobium sp. 17]|uniref:hypothetical protein n=1 Tax=Bradyrhizobium sp. 17 TaxID=2782649 RepID=UPI001FFAC479|nr:hypothetical protein [Bradyrhizobium sp. 17]
MRALLNQGPDEAASPAASIRVTLPMPARRNAKAKRASGLPAADDGDVVIDPLTVRDPVLRIGSNQAQGLARRSVDIGLKHIRTSIVQHQMRSNRRSERYSVNEMESALFFNPHNEPIAGLRRVERFA